MRSSALPILPDRDAICAGCGPRICCYHYKVTLSGHDLWRIARTLDLSPQRFAVATPAEPDSDDAFALDVRGGRCELVLAKTADPRRFGGCLFLVRTNDGAHRCGLGDLRPAACRLYPVFFRDGLLRVINDPDGCWRSWSPAEFDAPDEAERWEERERRRAEYRRIVADWNRRVWARSERTFTFADYCSYLENRYGEIYPEA